MKTLLFSLLAGTLALSGCMKEDLHQIQQPINPTPQNITGTYILVGLCLRDNQTTETDLFANIDVCAQDNIYSLRPNGGFVYTDAGMVCDPTINETSTWSLQDRRGLRLGSVVYRIEQFNGMRMALGRDTIVDGRPYRLIKKFLRQ